MATKHQTTREEEAFDRLFKEKKQMLSEAGYATFWQAENAADAQYLGCTGYCYDPSEYVEAMKKMHLASAKLTGQDREILTELRHAAAAAAASIDPDDRTFVWRKTDAGDLHSYYKMISNMLEETLREDAAEIIRDLEERLLRIWFKDTPQEDVAEIMRDVEERVREFEERLAKRNAEMDQRKAPEWEPEDPSDLPS